MDLKRKRAIVFGLFLAAVLCLGLLIAAFSKKSEEGNASVSGFPISINEIMTSNKGYYDQNGNAYDWIELYNSSNRSVSLSQYKLTDTERKVRYTFPNGAEIPAGGYYIVWCRSNAGTGDYANFSLSKAGGETVVLMNGRSVIVDRVVTQPLEQDTSMARGSDGEWQVLGYGTPGYENTETGYQQYLAAHRENAAEVRISEIMVSNRSYLDENNVSSDWIELCNETDEAIDLTGFRLSDRADAAGYTFPEGTEIPADGYLVVRCDGGSAGEGYAPFSLSSGGGETVRLSCGDVVIDSAVTLATEKDVSIVRGEDGAWTVSETPTPGFANTEAGYEAYLASVVQPGADVRITELMASNLSCITDSDGDFSDWIELTNCGEEGVDLGGYVLSDGGGRSGGWTLPDVKLAAGGRIVVFASGKDRADAQEPHTDFSLNRHQGEVLLYAPDGQIVCSVQYTELGENESYSLDETTGEWAATESATPGFPNNDAGYEAFEQTLSADSPLIISEAMSGNGSFLRQSRGQYFDWIELKNQSEEPIDLSGYSITDNLEKTEYCALPAVTLKPGAFFVLLCTGDTPLVKSQYSQLALSLDAQNDRLYLVGGEKTVVDCLTLSGAPYGVSIGRLSGENGQFYFADPTPGEENSDGYRTISDRPEASPAQGVYNDAGSVTVTLSGEGDIYYTTDGSVPTEKSRRYEGPITLEQTAVVRACAVSAGKMISVPLTLNYIIGTGVELPVVAVTTDEKNLYDESIGILADGNLFDRSVVRPANVSFFSDEGNFSAECGLKLHGAGSRGLALKKSFKVVFREKYGQGQLDFPLFEGNDRTSFDSFLIRNGQDNGHAIVRDELISKIARSGAPELLVQDTRFCVLYINGEYQGIYCIKEAFTSGYFAARYGVDKESVEVQRGYISTDSDFKRLVEFAISNDLSKEENYRYVEERVNLESLCDWCICEAYTGNTDLAVNVRYYRSTEYDGNRWHYALFDMDYGFGGEATFDHILNSHWHGSLFKSLLKNEEFQKLFLTRMAYQLENNLTDENVIASFYTLTDEIRSEVPRERELWPVAGVSSWETFCGILEKRILSGRADQMKKSIAQAMRIPLAEVESYFGGGA